MGRGGGPLEFLLAGEHRRRRSLQVQHGREQLDPLKFRRLPLKVDDVES